MERRSARKREAAEPGEQADRPDREGQQGRGVLRGSGRHGEARDGCTRHEGGGRLRTHGELGRGPEEEVDGKRHESGPQPGRRRHACQAGVGEDLRHEVGRHRDARDDLAPQRSPRRWAQVLEPARHGVAPESSRAAGTRPASHPGARPPAGGPIEAMSWPLPARSHEISELEFHMSPVRCSSSAQVAVRNRGTSPAPVVHARRRAHPLRTVHGLAHVGDPPARPAADLVAEHRDRPSQVRPTAPSPTTPRCGSRVFHTGAISIAHRPAPSLTSSAEW